MNLLGCCNKREFRILSFHPTTQVAVAYATWWPALLRKRQLPPILIGAPLLLSRMRLTDPSGFWGDAEFGIWNFAMLLPIKMVTTSLVYCKQANPYIVVFFSHSKVANGHSHRIWIKVVFSENYAKGNIDRTSKYRRWMGCKEPILDLSLTPVL